MNMYKIRVLCLYSIVYVSYFSVQVRKNTVQMYESVA